MVRPDVRMTHHGDHLVCVPSRVLQFLHRRARHRRQPLADEERREHVEKQAGRADPVANGEREPCWHTTRDAVHPDGTTNEQVPCDAQPGTSSAPHTHEAVCGGACDDKKLPPLRGGGRRAAHR